jgi:hypothetical protein
MPERSTSLPVAAGVGRSSVWSRVASAPAWKVPAPAALAMFALLAFVPLQPTLTSAALDASWDAVLHDAFLRRLQFGRDIVFTFGPLGFIYSGAYHAETFALMLACRISIAAAASFAMWMLLASCIRAPLPRLLAAGTLLSLAALSMDTLLLAPPALLLARWCSGTWRWSCWSSSRCSSRRW